MDRIKAFINGSFKTSDGDVLVKINPVNGRPIAEVEKTTDTLLQDAIEAAKIQSLTGQERGQIMAKVSNS